MMITVLQGIPLHRLPICGKMNPNMTKVLAVSDQVVERLYSLSVNGHFHDVDLLLGCGDLPYTYLEYLITVLNVPLYYVPGNHDPQYSVRGSLSRAEGGVNLDLKSTYFKGLLLAGFGGSIRYRPDGVNQYTQSQAFFRAYRLLLNLLINWLRNGRKLDILISHSPPFKIHDDDTQAHQGLKALNFLIGTLQPRYLFHGHTHFYRQNLEHSVTQVGPTTIMNIFPYKTIVIKDG